MSYTKNTWVNNGTPAINATNLNNIENGVEANDIAITSLTNTTNDLKGQILWENANPTTEITTDTVITLDSDDYDVYEVIYAYNTSNLIQMSVKSTKGKGTLLLFTVNNANTYRRIIEYVSDTSLRIRSQEQSQDSYAIPIYIIGYKTGLFS